MKSIGFAGHDVNFPHIMDADALDWDKPCTHFIYRNHIVNELDGPSPKYTLVHYQPTDDPIEFR